MRGSPLSVLEFKYRVELGPVRLTYRPSHNLLRVMGGSIIMLLNSQRSPLLFKANLLQ